MSFGPHPPREAKTHEPGAETPSASAPFALSLDALPTSAALIDGAGVRLAGNSKLAALESSLEPAAVDELAHALAAVAARARRNGADETHVRLRAPDGRSRILSLEAAVADPPTAPIVVCVREVTRGHELARMIEFAPFVIMRIGADGLARFVSPAIATQRGRRPEDVVGRPVEELVHPDDRARVLETIAALRAGASPLAVAFRSRNAALEWTWRESLAVAMPAEVEGEPGEVVAFTRDLTEYTRQVEALRESELRYRQLFDNLSSALSVQREIRDESGAIVDYEWIDANPAYERLVGIPKANLIGQRATALLGPRSTRSIALFSKLALPMPDDQSLLFEASPGRWFEVRAFAPSPGVLAVTSVDRTREHLAAETLRESERRFRLLAENSTDLISRRDADDRLLYVSPASTSLLGYTPEEMLEQSAVDIVIPEDRAAKLAAGEAARLTGATTAVRYRVRKKDGTVRWVESLCRSVFGDGDSKGELQVSTRDVHEQVLLEQRLRRAREFQDTVIDTVDALIMVLEPDGRIRSFNRACQRASGWTEREVIGKNFIDLLMVPEIRERAHRLYARYVSGDLPGTVAGEWLTKSGERLWIEATSASVFDEVGRVQYVISTGIERTAARRAAAERDAAAAALADLNATLEQRVAERTRELAAVNEELETFSYSVSHDLRAPLRSIDGFSRVLLEDLGETLAPDARATFDRIIAATRRMGELIDDLLALSRSSRAELRPTTVDLSAMAEETLEALRRVDRARVVSVRIAPGLTAVADPALARTVLENLLGNAWKYTSKKPEAAIAFQRATEAGAPADGFEVVDDGAGFDMRFAGKLFAPFSRLHTRSEFEGNGIGLATVRRILHRHGGFIRASGEVGRGARFTFSFGAQRPTATRASGETAAAAPPARRG